VADVERIPRSHWEEMPVGNVMSPLVRLRAVAPEESLTSVLPLVSGRDMNQLPVARHGRVVGVISRDAIMSFVEARHHSMLPKPEPEPERRTWEDDRRREMKQITAPLPTQPQMQPQTQDITDHYEPM
jgi:hypothetical protein